MKRKPASRIAAVVHETACDFYSTGAIGAAEMAEYDSLCLVPAPAQYGPRQIRALRRRHEISCEGLASILNVGLATVRQWESGQTRPRGSALRLLELLDAKGPGVLLAAQAPAPRRHAATPRAHSAGRG